MITLVNYGLGNILAFRNIYNRLNISVQVASTRSELNQAQRLILPGVGAFDWAMERLVNSGMRETLDELVLVRKVPVLGICVGMQIMARGSEEGDQPGLGWIAGEVRKFDEVYFEGKTYLPHMGWNRVFPQEHPLFAGIDCPEFYFLHSYYFGPDSDESCIAVTEYGMRFASAVSRDNIFGVQFHPEKSHDWGNRLLRNFAVL